MIKAIKLEIIQQLMTLFNLIKLKAKMIKLITMIFTWNSKLNKDKVMILSILFPFNRDKAMLLSILILCIMEKKNYKELTFKRHFAINQYVFQLENFLIG